MTKKRLYFQAPWHLSNSSLSFFSSFTPSQAQWLLCCSQNMLAILLSHNFWLAIPVSEMLFLKIFLNSFLHFLHFYSNVFLSGSLGLTNVKWTSVQFSRSVVSNSLWPHEPPHTRPPVHHQLPESTQTHVHWVGDAIQPSHPLRSPSPPAFNLSQPQALMNIASHISFFQLLFPLLLTLFYLFHSSFQLITCHIIYSFIMIIVNTSH